MLTANTSVGPIPKHRATCSPQLRRSGSVILQSDRDVFSYISRKGFTNLWIEWQSLSIRIQPLLFCRKRCSASHLKRNPVIHSQLPAFPSRSVRPQRRTEFLLQIPTRPPKVFCSLLSLFLVLEDVIFALPNILH